MARRLLFGCRMKIFFVVLVIGAGVFYWQSKSRTAATATDEKNSTAPIASVTPRPVYEHDWAKHSLDRTHEVMDQVGKTRKENEQP
jgi:hypothetical protein